MEQYHDNWAGNSFPIIRETIAYGTGAADGLKDVFILTQKHIAVVTIGQLSYLPNVFDEENELIISLLDAVKTSVPKFIARLDDVIRAEISPNKTYGCFLLGNKRFGYELHIETKLPSGIRQKVALLIYENGSRNVLVALQNLVGEHLQIETSAFTIQAKDRIVWFRKYSGFILFFTYIWPIYRFLRHVIFRKPKKESKYLTEDNRRSLEDKSNRRPFTNPPLGLLFKSLGIFLFLINTTGVAGIIAFLLLFTDLNNVNEIKYYTGLGLVLSLYYLPTFLIPLFVYLGYRLSLRPLTKGNQKSDRTILFLRAFDEDGRNTFFRDPLSSLLLSLDVPYWFKWIYRGWLGWIANYHPLRNIRMMLSITRDTAEEQIASFLQNYGNVIAIGKPGEVLRQGGAIRKYVSNESWQEEVLELIAQTDLVLVQPAETEGIWWELRELLNHKQKQHILFSLVNFRQNPERYERFKHRFETEFASKIAKPLPVKMPDEHFLFFDSKGEPQILPTYYHSPFAWPRLGYDINFKKTLFPFLYDQPVDKTKTSKSRSSISWIAVIGSFIVWISAFLLFSGIIYISLSAVLYPDFLDESWEDAPYFSQSSIEIYPGFVVLTGEMIKAGHIYSFTRNDTLWPAIIKDLPLTKEFASQNERAALRLEIRPSVNLISSSAKPDSAIKIVNRYAERLGFDYTVNSHNNITYDGESWQFYYLLPTAGNSSQWVGRAIFIHSGRRVDVLIDILLPEELIYDAIWEELVIPSIQQFKFVRQTPASTR